MVAFLTDDPAALEVLAGADLSFYARTRVLASPMLPLEALVRATSPRASETADAAVLAKRLAAAPPSGEVFSLAVSLGNWAAVTAVLRHRDLSAELALSWLDFPDPAVRDEAGKGLLGRSDLPLVLSRSSSGVDGLPRLLASLERLLGDAPLGVAWFEHRASAASKVVQAVLEAPGLGLGGPVPADVVSLFVPRPEFHAPLLNRSDLSAGACLVLADAACAAAEEAASGLGLTFQELLFPPAPHPFPLEQVRRRLASGLSALTRSPECPRSVAERIPLVVADLSPLALLLPDDPRVWEVALGLVAESPVTTFGDLAAAAVSLAS